MTDEQFRALLDLLMVSDPWPLAATMQEDLVMFADGEARKRNFVDWINAYHLFKVCT